MRSGIGIAWVLAALSLPASASAAPAASQPSRDVVKAISRGDCDAAVLGYICTVRGLASRRLRETVPRGAFLPGRAARVAFNPASGIMQIRSTPRVASAPDTTAGTFVQRPLIDAQWTIDKAWRDALSTVPRPDAARLEDQGVELTLDLDITIEGGPGSGPGAHPLPNGSLMPGDLRPQPGPASPFGH